MPGLEGTALGHYRLRKRLGHGGMAEVYLAEDERIHREVALKIVSSSQDEFAERFSREAQAMGKLYHEHLLPAYDYGEQEPWHYLVMPYIEHGSLNDLLQHGPLTLEHAGEILQQVASALQYAHQQGLVHRDIKPANILLRDDHYAYVADFGLARVLEGSHLTQTGTLLGTPEYMAPELTEGPASQSSDTYSLAIVLYQMLSGRVPFHGDTPIATFWKQLRETPQAPSHLNPALPQAVDHVLLRALAKDPQQRYATPLALSQAYQEAINVVDDMPPLEGLEETPQHMMNQESVAPLAPAITPVHPEQAQQPPNVSPQPARLFLPGTAIGSTPHAQGGQRPHSPITPRQNFDYATERVAPERSQRAFQTPQPPRRRRTNRVFIGIIMGLVLLLAIIGLVAYATVSTRGQQGTVAANTPKASTTGTPIGNPTAQARATQQAATSVVATATAQSLANQQATATAITGGKPLLSDPLSGPDGNNWSNDGTNCSFKGGSYIVTSTASNTLQPCISSSLHYTNAAFQVDVMLNAGADAGLIFRASADETQFYDFEITDQGQFYVRYRANGSYTSLITSTANSAIQGSGSKNTLLAIANGPDLQFFINGTFVGEVQDSTFSSGQIGFVAGTLAASSGSASFANMRVYGIT